MNWHKPYKGDWNASQELADRICTAWDEASPSPFIAGTIMWPSFEFIADCMREVLRQCGVNPFQKPDAVTGQISVSVRDATQRLECYRKPLVFSVFGNVIWIHKKRKPIGTLHLGFPFQGDSFTVKFYSDVRTECAVIINHKVNHLLFVRLNCDLVSRPAKESRICWRDGVDVPVAAFIKKYVESGCARLKKWTVSASFRKRLFPSLEQSQNPPARLGNDGNNDGQQVVHESHNKNETHTESGQ